MKIYDPKVQVVNSGHTFYNEIDDSTLTVTDGSPVQGGNGFLYVTENDYRKLIKDHSGVSRDTH